MDQCLPFAHTCYFTLDLPRYSCKEVLKNKLLFAIENCPEIDGDQTNVGRRSIALGFELDDDSNDEGDPYFEPPPALNTSEEQRNFFSEQISHDWNHPGASLDGMQSDSEEEADEFSGYSIAVL